MAGNRAGADLDPVERSTDAADDDAAAADDRWDVVSSALLASPMFLHIPWLGRRVILTEGNPAD